MTKKKLKLMLEVERKRGEYARNIMNKMFSNLLNENYCLKRGLKYESKNVFSV